MKVGDRVRINIPGSSSHMKEATICGIEDGSAWHPMFSERNGQTCYLVDIDGIGKENPYRDGLIGCLRHELIPIQPTVTWEEFREATGIDIREPVLLD